MIGLVGSSGAGKSTLINLIMRLYDVDDGKILLDGTDLRDIKQVSLHSQIGVVLQETFLFSGTIYDNIRYAKPDAKPEEVIQAAKMANVHEFVTRFPDGYDTYVGEHGYNLSGGERQRVGIARIMLLDPDLIVMDEPTSSLDILREKELLYTLQKACSDKMLLLVSHRPSTLTGCTRLIRLEHGKAVPV